jgi:hypothetical protein
MTSLPPYTNFASTFIGFAQREKRQKKLHASRYKKIWGFGDTIQLIVIHISSRDNNFEELVYGWFFYNLL